MTETKFPKNDIDTLRRLAARIAQAAALIQNRKTELWTRLNDLNSARPMLLIYQVPWHEMNINDELTLRCENRFARTLEERMRKLLYQHTHFPGDMVIDPYWPCPLVVNDSGFGLAEEAEVIQSDAASDIKSRDFQPVITVPEDVEKIKMAQVSHDAATTEKTFSAMHEIFGDILPVVKQGVQTIWYTPWDNLIRWWGVEQAMMDLILRPDMVHEAVARCAKSMHCALDQMIEQNLLSPGACNVIAGSGGYAYCSELPGDNYDPARVLPHNNWGCSNAQIFSAVSPEMHWEFAIKHDLPWLERWGLNYYGCCEPLDGKIEILKYIPNLRKISMSPWINIDRAVEAIADKYVFSYKPNPAFLAEDVWRPGLVREMLREVIDKTDGCHLEIILKDISTVRYEPRRLWEWHDIAMSLLEKHI